MESRDDAEALTVQIRWSASAILLTITEGVVYQCR